MSELTHYGTPRHSGRYPWGSGKTPYQRAKRWRDHIQEMKDQGMSDIDIAKAEGITTTQLRARLSITKDEIRAANVARVLAMKDRGYSNMEIARRMSDEDKTWNESSIRALLDPTLAERSTITATTAKMLKEQVDQKRFVDVGAGVEQYIGVSATRLNTALAELKEQGYKIHQVNVPQVGMPGKFTVMKVLGAPDTEWKEVVKNPYLIKELGIVSDDYGRSFQKKEFGPIQSVDASRVKVRYGSEGGSDKDGVIELRRGVNDLDLGGSKYAQVRIGVNGTHYIKGMAIYSDNMPDGVDIIFNTNKSNTGNKLDVLKKMNRLPDGTVDLENPFSATIKDNGRRGALNIVNEEGDWDTWSRTLSSQMLSKQNPSLAKRQLDLSYKEKLEEYEEIMSLTNPVVKKQLLLSFADDCDSSAVHLKAAGLPRQASQVILPIPDIKESEVYAPNFRNGERVVLIRHPHGGTFEIPELTVNNKSKSAQAIMKNAKDAIGIHPNVAKKLSGADFDGDSVIVIPNNSGLVKSSASLKALKNFDPITAYPPYDGMRTIDGGTYNAKTRDVDYGKTGPRTQNKQTKMGEVSNLITDMTIKGANLDEIARAVKHSMVVIDSEKHHLNYKQSYIDNGIAALSAKYQGSSRGGASTLISQAKSKFYVDERKEGAFVGPVSSKTGKPTKLYIDPETGKKLYTYTGTSYEKLVKIVDPETGKAVINPDTGKPMYRATGKIVKRQTTSTKMAETDDAFSLSSGTQIENVYASYANSLKSLANKARLDTLSITPTPYSPSARRTYEPEVRLLETKLNIAKRNKPIERQAQILANSIIERKKLANPYMDDDDLKKVKNQALAEARARTGAKKNLIEITDREWEAIQAGAVSSSTLSEIIQNASLDKIKQLATPRPTTLMSPTKVARAKTMLNSGLTQAEVAEALGVSTSTLFKSLEE
jgi:DNA-binding CsgD family transcriptional regulator